MSLITAIGLAAGALTTLAFLPQVVKTWKSKSSDDISAGTFGMLCTGVCLWLLYGLLNQDLPLILTNVVTLVLVGTMLVLTLVYRRRKVHRS